MKTNQHMTNFSTILTIHCRSFIMVFSLKERQISYCRVFIRMEKQDCLVPDAFKP